MADARGNHGEPAQAIPRSEGAGRTRCQVGAARGENHFRHLSYPCRCLFDNHIRRARTPSPRRTAEARCRATEACEADVGHRDLLLCRSGRTKAHRTRRSRVFTRCKINLAPAQNLVCDRSRHGNRGTLQDLISAPTEYLTTFRALISKRASEGWDIAGEQTDYRKRNGRKVSGLFTRGRR